MKIPNIVQGNDFSMSVNMLQLDQVGEAHPYNLTNCTDIKCFLTTSQNAGGCVKRIPVDFDIDETLENVIVIHVHSERLETNSYGLEIIGTNEFGQHWRFKALQNELFHLVDPTSAESDIDDLQDYISLDAKIGLSGLHTDFDDLKDYIDIQVDVAFQSTQNYYNKSEVNDLIGGVESNFDDYTKTDDLGAAALSNDYNDLDNKPVNVSDFNNDAGYLTEHQSLDDYYTKTQVDNKLSDKADIDDLANVATSGDYDDLSNKPTNVSEFNNDAGYVNGDTLIEDDSWTTDSTKTVQTILPTKPKSFRFESSGNEAFVIKSIAGREDTWIDIHDAAFYFNISDDIYVLKSEYEDYYIYMFREPNANEYNPITYSYKQRYDINDIVHQVDTNKSDIADRYTKSETDSLLQAKANNTDLANVATSGDYDDLSNKPDLATVATSGDYNDLSNKPTIPTVPTNVSAFSNDAGYLVPADIAGKANTNDLATVATSGDYNDLSNKPNIPDMQVQSDWTEQDSNAKSFILHKPDLAAVATSGSYNDLSDKPDNLNFVAIYGTTTNAEITNALNSNKTVFVKGTVTSGGSSYNVYLPLIDAKQPYKFSGIIYDLSYTVQITKGGTWYATIQGLQPAINGNNKLPVAYINGLATVATSGSYNDLSNKPDLATVATSGDYDDLSNKPTIPTVPTNVSAFNNDAGYLTSSDIAGKADTDDLKPVAFSGSYEDLEDKPTIPGIPTNVSAFNNDAGYLTSSDIAGKANTADLKPVAFSGSYSDLINKPSNLNFIAVYNTTTKAEIDTAYNAGKTIFVKKVSNNVIIILPLVNITSQYYAFGGIINDKWFATRLLIASGSWEAVTETAVQPQLNNNNKLPVGYVSGLHNVATSGDYRDLNHKPTIPTIPTNVSAFNNDAGYLVQSDIAGKANTTDLDPVATSGDYRQLNHKPDLKTVATSGSYNDLSDKPTIPTVPTNVSAFNNDAGYLVQSDIAGKANTADLDPVATSGDYRQLNHKPTNVSEFTNDAGYLTENTVESVALTGDYDDLHNTPTNVSEFTNDAGYLTEHQSLSNYYNKTQVDSKLSVKANDADLATVAKTGSYNDLEDKPHIPTISGQAQVDWNESDPNDVSYILNKPTNVSAFNNDVGYLTDQLQSDWNVTDTSDPRYISNKPTKVSDFTNDTGYLTSSDIAGKANTADLAEVAFSGSYSNIIGRPTKVSDLPNDAGYITSSDIAGKANSADLATVATSGSYNDLSNKPNTIFIATHGTTTSTEIDNALSLGKTVFVKKVNGNNTTVIPLVSSDSSWYNFGGIIDDRWFATRMYKSNNTWENINTLYPQQKITATNKLSTDYISGLNPVATSGSYNDLSGKPTNVSAFNNDAGYLTENTAARVAITGDYNDLINKPMAIFIATHGTTTATDISTALNDGRTVFVRYTSGSNSIILPFIADANGYYEFCCFDLDHCYYTKINKTTSEWNQVSTTLIQERITSTNKLPAANVSGLATVATTGDYSNLQNAPRQVSDLNNDAGYITASDVLQSDWDQTDTSAKDFILNKPTNVSEFTNDAGYLLPADVAQKVDASDLWPIAFSGLYEDLRNPPKIKDPGTIRRGDGIASYFTQHYNQTIGENSVILGEGNTLTPIAATNYHSVAIGQNVQSTANNAIAMGLNSVAAGDVSIAMGDSSISTNDHAVAIGTGAKASGTHSTYIGYGGSNSMSGYNGAYGEKSICLGTYLNTSNYGEVAVGKYNDTHSGNTLFSVGNGTDSANNRNNALEIMKDGSIYIDRNSQKINLQDRMVTSNTSHLNIVITGNMPANPVANTLYIIVE